MMIWKEPSPQPPSATLWASLSQWERGYKKMNMEY